MKFCPECGKEFKIFDIDTLKFSIKEGNIC